MDNVKFANSEKSPASKEYCERFKRTVAKIIKTCEDRSALPHSAKDGSVYAVNAFTATNAKGEEYSTLTFQTGNQAMRVVFDATNKPEKVEAKRLYVKDEKYTPIANCADVDSRLLDCLMALEDMKEFKLLAPQQTLSKFRQLLTICPDNVPYVYAEKDGKEDVGNDIYAVTGTRVGREGNEETYINIRSHKTKENICVGIDENGEAKSLTVFAYENDKCNRTFASIKNKEKVADALATITYEPLKACTAFCIDCADAIRQKSMKPEKKAEVEK